MKNLHKFRFDVYSQNGEDGVINEILKRSIENRKLNVVEFGAGDIEENSNTFNLIKKDKVNFSVFIEQDFNLFEKLKILKLKYPTIIPINKTIDFKKNSDDNICKILKKNNISNNLDIMSIDIDSNDLDVYRTINEYHPKLLIIEAGRQKYNVFSENSVDKKMNSFSSIYKCISKKYYLICYNGNLFFLNKDSFSEKHIKKNYYTDDEYHYLLHCIYVNYKKRGLFKKILIDLFARSKLILKLFISYK